MGERERVCVGLYFVVSRYSGVQVTKTESKLKAKEAGKASFVMSDRACCQADLGTTHSSR